MHCPACQQAMLILEYKGIELDHCLACGGVWLDAGELGLLLHGVPEPPEGLALAGARPGERRCPRCPRKMDVGRFPDSAVEVDVCPARHGLWLDRGELLVLAGERTDLPDADAVIRHLRELFGAEQNQTKEKKT